MVFIVDNRSFDKLSFNGVKKPQTFVLLLKALSKNDLESACHWLAEIDISNWQELLWDKLIIYSSKIVHLHNPRLPQLLEKKLLYFSKLKPAERRNNEEMRRNWCQILSAIVFSNKGPVYELPTTKNNPIDLDKCIIHPWVNSVSQKDDSLTVQLLISRALYNKEFHEKLYTLNYLLEIEKLKEHNLKISPRKNNVLIPDNTNTDWIWLYWEVVLKNTAWDFELYKTLNSLFFLFCYNYSTSKKKSRIPILIHSFLLISNQVDFKKEIFQQVDLTQKACTNINIMYQEIRDNKDSSQSVAESKNLKMSSTEKIDLVDKLYYYGI
jgi:hypothetical protein